MATITTPAATPNPTPIDLTFEGKKVRFVGTAERPEWIAQDVCDALDIVNSRSAIAGFDEDEKGVHTVYTLGGKQTHATVYEAGLYILILRSRKPEAKKFRKWILSEVLPSIRKFGTYPPPRNSRYAVTLKTYTSRIAWVMQVRGHLLPDYWCVFIEGAEILIGAEQLFGQADLEMKQHDLLDASIGAHWSKFRFGKPWAGSRILYEYAFPEGDPRGTVRPWSYPDIELAYFKNWLHSEYWTIHMPAYIERKYGAVEYQRALPVMASLGIPMTKHPSKKAISGPVSRGEQTSPPLRT